MVLKSLDKRKLGSEVGLVWEEGYFSLILLIWGGC